MKIFVSAYACEPNLGSEIGVGWHWVLEMSKYFELWVLTRESNRKNIEPWIADHPEFANIHWLYYDLPKWARWWKKGLRGVRTYYIIWQTTTNCIVKRTMQEHDIHVFHHLTYGNALWKVSSYGRKQTFIWGPIGGLETIPEDFTRCYGVKWKTIEWVRRWTVKMLCVNKGFNDRCKNANLIFCKTEDTIAKIPEGHRDKARLMTDVACENVNENHNENHNDKQAKDSLTEGGNIRFVTVGRLDAWRGFDLVVEAFSALACKRENVELTIVGKGSDHKRLTKLIGQTAHKERIRMVGAVSQDDYHSLMRGCDVVVNAALKEGAVTVVFDAIAYGKPLVCVESGGYTKALNKVMSVTVSKKNRDETIMKLCEGMECFCDEQQRRAAADECGRLLKTLNWEEKGKVIRDAILEIAK